MARKERRARVSAQRRKCSCCSNALWSCWGASFAFLAEAETSGFPVLLSDEDYAEAALQKKPHAASSSSSISSAPSPSLMQSGMEPWMIFSPNLRRTS